MSNVNANVADIFRKHALQVPLDVKNALDLDQQYAIFASVFLLSPNSICEFLQELEERIEDAVWEKIRKAQKKC